MKLQPDETRLAGTWQVRNGSVVADDVCHRIEELAKTYLRALRRDSSGWDVLYLDPSDGRLWELTYPASELHGGGPPELKLLSEKEAKQKYGLP